MKQILAALSTVPLIFSSAWAAIDIQEVKSPLGIEAWLVEDHSIPFVALELLFKGGSTLEPPDKSGATYLMSGLLEEGAADLDAAAFQRRQELLAARFGFSAYKESVSVSAQILTENRSESVELLRKALQEPRFDDEAVARVKAQVLSILADNETDPGELASDLFNKRVFGGHAYGRTVEGTVETVNPLTSDDLFAIHGLALTRDNVVVGAAGDITSEELGLLLDDLLGALPVRGSASPEHPEYILDGGITVRDFPSPQSVAYFGHRGILRSDPDFLAAYVLNEIVGGRDIDGRLKTEVREKRGLTYGTGTYLVGYKNIGLILGYVASANEKIAEAVDVIKSVWEEVAESGITEEELEQAKVYLTGAYPLRFDGNLSIAGILAGMQADEMPASYIKNRNAMVEALTLDDINRIARKLFKPDDLHFVVVGQPAGLNQAN